MSDGRKRPEGSPDLRDKVAYKNDEVIEVAMANNGFVFALQNYDLLEAKQKRGFTLTLSAAIADLTSRTEYKMECLCYKKHGLFPEQLCHIVDTNVLPPVVRRTSLRS